MLKKVLNHKIVLASKSPRRQELLKGLDIDFEIRTKEIDEYYPEYLKETEIPIYLSELKANAFNGEIKENELFITSDTIVCIGGKVLEKPQSTVDAKQMLRELSGHTHQVHTAVCLKSIDKEISFCDSTSVQFKTLTEGE